MLVLGVGALSAVGGVVYALFQHDLKRLLALHSIENVGIIVLGIGACLVLRARGADTWAAFALAAALLHTLNHAVFKALLFLGAGAFERAVGSLELDRLGGLLRRMPWTGGAFLVGAMAIAGLPPLNGFASEWLTLQALLHVSAYGNVGGGIAGALALGGARRDRGARRLLLRQGGRARAARAAAPRTAVADAVEAPLPMRAAVVFLAVALRRARRSRPGCCSARSSGSRRGRRRAPTHVGLHLPGTGSLPTAGIARRARRAHGRARSSLRGGAAPRPRRPGPAASSSSPQLDWTSAGFTKPLRLVLEAVLRPEREIAVRSAGRRRPGGHLPRPRAASDRRARLPARRPRLARARRGHARRLQSGSLGTYVVYLIALVRRAARRRPARADRMSAATAAVGGACRSSAGSSLAPLLPGLVQHWKARLQGRRGPTPLQPYRELRRLWGKSTVDVEGTDARLPARAGGRRRQPRRRRPARPGRRAGARTRASATTRSRSLGLLALARFALAAASWDVAQRLLADGREPRPDDLGVRRGDARPLARASRRSSPGRPTCAAIVAGDGGHGRSGRARRSALGAVAFALVVVAETGRQPVDNPDTHLELTMIHEGPLLEYAGRDLAYLQWAAAARHWLVLVLAAQVFLPHAGERLVAARAAARRARRPVRGARADGDARREDARSCSSRGCSPSARWPRCSGSRLTWWGSRERRARLAARRARPASSSSCAGARSRSRSLTVQALVLAGVALDEATTGRRPRRRRRAGRAGARAGGAVPRPRLAHARAATRPRRVAPLVRAGVAVALALALTWLVPSIGLDSRNTERAVLALVAFGIVTTATRRATLFQVMGVVLVENGARARRARAPRRLVAAIELGVALDLTLVVARRRGLPRADLRRVRRRRQRRSEEAP